MAEEMNYVVGAGKVYFDAFQPDTVILTGERYLGNTPGLGFAQTENRLDHYSAEGGVKVKDRSVLLNQDTNGTLTCDHVSNKNVAMWWLAEVLNNTILAGTGLTETINSVALGTFHQIGKTDAQPQGFGDLTSVTVNSNNAVKATGTVTLGTAGTATDTVVIAGTTITLVASGAVGAQVNIGATATDTAQALKAYINSKPALPVVASGNAAIITLSAKTGGAAGNALTLTKTGTSMTVSGATLTGGAAGAVTAPGNFNLDLPRGRIEWLEGATNITNGDTLTLTYSNSAQTQELIIEKGKTIEGALRYIADNAEGDDKDAYLPYVKLTPTGDFALKGETWQEMQFTIEVIKKNSSTPRIIWINRPKN